MIKLGKIKRACASISARERAPSPSSHSFTAASLLLGMLLTFVGILALINVNAFIEPQDHAASLAGAQVGSAQQDPLAFAPTELSQPSPSGPTTDCGPHKHAQAGGCVCLPGHGGTDCSFSHVSIFGTFPTYASLKGSPQYLPEDLQGWSPPAEVYEMYLGKANASTVIEVGVWKGLSAIHMAKWLKSRNSGVLVAVDTWLGAAEFWSPKNMNASDRSLKLLHGWPTVYFQFLSNVGFQISTGIPLLNYLVVHQGLEDFIVPLPQTSKLATVLLKVKGLVADLVHIDAAHEYGSVREDIHLWWPFVRQGGYLLGDDFTWPGVVKAAQEFSTVCELQLELEGVKWAIQKPPQEWFSGRPYLPDFCSRGAYGHYDGLAIGLF